MSATLPMPSYAAHTTTAPASQPATPGRMKLLRDGLLCLVAAFGIASCATPPATPQQPGVDRQFAQAEKLSHEGKFLESAQAYEALAAKGPHAHRVFAFARRSGAQLTVAVAPRLTGAADGWRDTVLPLPPGAWRNVLTDQVVSGPAVALAELWRAFPTALLVEAPGARA